MPIDKPQAPVTPPSNDNADLRSLRPSTREMLRSIFASANQASAFAFHLPGGEVRDGLEELPRPEPRPYRGTRASLNNLTQEHREFLYNTFDQAIQISEENLSGIHFDDDDEDASVTDTSDVDVADDITNSTDHTGSKRSRDPDTPHGANDQTRTP